MRQRLRRDDLDVELFLVDEAGALGAGNFVADGESADGGSNHYVAIRQLGGQFAAKALGDGGMLEYERTLHIFARMETAGETEVAFEIGTGFTEGLQDRFRHEINYSKALP